MRVREYLQEHVKDLVYGANDGIVTTFAVVASVVGARLEAAVILIVGFASLVADGPSMAASGYLAGRSERSALEQRGEEAALGAAEARPLLSATLTFAAFVLAGSLPLLPYVLVPDAGRLFAMTAVATAAALLIIGGLRTLATGRPALRGALEMLLVGGVAVSAAFLIGRYVEGLPG